MYERPGEEFRRCRRCERSRIGHRIDHELLHCAMPGQQYLYDPELSLESDARIAAEILIAAARSGFYWPTLPSGVRHFRGALHRLYREAVDGIPQGGLLVDPLRRP